MKNRLALSVCFYTFLMVSCSVPIEQALRIATPLEKTSTPISQIKFLINGQSLGQDALDDFMIQKLRKSGFTPPKKTKSKKHSENKSNKKKDARKDKGQVQLLIEDILLTPENVSVFGPEASAAVTPDLTGGSIPLTIKGSFTKESKKPLPLKEFRFTYAPPLIQQTFIGEKPQARVLLDDAILLEVISSTATELKVLLNPKDYIDLYLKGLHKISVEYKDYYTDALISIGEGAIPPRTLEPQIESVEILYDDDKDSDDKDSDDKNIKKIRKSYNIRLKGTNFMLNPKYYYTLIDGEFGFGHQTEVMQDGSYETVVHLPEPKVFAQKTEHQVIFVTPFGVTFKEFGKLKW